MQQAVDGAQGATTASGDGGAKPAAGKSGSMGLTNKKKR